MMRVADYVISYLEDIGIRNIFTVTGGGSIFFCDAVGRGRRMKYYACHHEQAVAMATEGYARASGGLGVSLVTSGPGGTNAVTGVAGSWMDSVPHLVLSGQAFVRQTIGDSNLRQFGVQEINIVDIIRPITKYAVMVTDANTIKYHLQKAIHLATTGRPGPVWLDVPADVQNTQIDAAQMEGFSPAEVQLEHDQDFKEKVSQVVTLLGAATRPLVHVGQGVKIAGAVDEFMSFVEDYRLPFVTARNANDIVATDHDLFVGRPGTFAQRGANFAVQNADVYLAIGTRLSLPQTGYNSKDFARHATKIMVDVDQAELDKKSLAIDLKIHLDAKRFLVELRQQLGKTRIGWTHWVKRCQSWKVRYPVVLPEYKDQKGSVNSYYFVDVLSDILTSEDVVVTDMGIAFQGTHQAFRVKQGQKFFTNSGLAPMGWGLPAAVGACVAHHKKRTVCIAGDGGLMMNIQELATVMHHKLPVKIFILNNGGYLTIRQTQKLGFEGRLMGSGETSGLSFPDFMKIADAHNIRAMRLDSHDQLQERLLDAIESDGPCICEIMMDREQVQGPMAINRRNPDGTSEPTLFEDMYPFLDRGELEENMVVTTGKKE